MKVKFEQDELVTRMTKRLKTKGQEIVVTVFAQENQNTLRERAERGTPVQQTEYLNPENKEDRFLLRKLMDELGRDSPIYTFYLRTRRNGTYIKDTHIQVDIDQYEAIKDLCENNNADDLSKYLIEQFEKNAHTIAKTISGSQAVAEILSSFQSSGIKPKQHSLPFSRTSNKYSSEDDVNRLRDDPHRSRRGSISLNGLLRRKDERNKVSLESPSKTRGSSGRLKNISFFSTGEEVREEKIKSDTSVPLKKEKVPTKIKNKKQDLEAEKALKKPTKEDPRNESSGDETYPSGFNIS